MLKGSKNCYKCVLCGNGRPTKIDWPNAKELKEMVEDTSYVEVGRMLGVSDNAVRKRIKNH
jgi:DNA-binding Lrp family transcriptional regulator